MPISAPDDHLRVTVLLFAGLRDAMRRDHLDVTIPCTAQSTLLVADLLAALAQQYPTLAAWLPHVRVAVNCEYSPADAPLREGDEIALIPPVAGG